ncbi:Bug family tripartite tricarboxylate transporter substrate binding protein [Plastoroseomonas hellenica]|uniref:Bug family tripartite tricarboxylate transporter substrate binding protein n=1 Tax=Plastoroseomonas hellenica TaxID=2687306 RepID=UPI001BA4BA13|nr:tripartite tricarboxylate transporter substrate binding protein [Plastoroseomonas hellenica]MBR0646722.1 tripartite tricarboxylate transporter substrate binding protein [Plastoroseomonas hellenica]
MTDRRSLLLAGLAAGILPRAASAQGEWPARPVTMVTGYAPGGVTDLATRAIAERMQRELGQPIVVDPKPGGATSVSATQVAQSRPDGHTLLMGTTSLAINPALQPGLTPRDPRQELAPIGMAYRTPFVLHLHPDVPARSTAELIAYAKANPGRLNFGSSGTGAVNHLCLEMFRREAGIDVVHIPYRGGAPALIDLRAGRIQGMFAAVLEALPAVREGATRAIAISSKDRLPLLPDVPPVAETLAGFDGVFWQGLFAPVGTPQPVLDRLGAVLRVATEDAGLRARLAEQGVALQTGDAAFLARLLATETESWGRLIRDAGIRPE